ncbi:MAG: glucose-1-phosphate cytidylyltransferase [Bacteroidaceae bacterium]|nr:glucose-1-phosphate cytidylyltransferase [Bacteroidaceae bacterium]
MKVVLLAGGFGTRFEEETSRRPKPMVEIVGMPLLWHIMKHYSFYGYNEFIICAGYKQDFIKEWFANYFLRKSDITFDFTQGKNEMVVRRSEVEPWKVTIADTGLNTMTGGRVKRVRDYVGHETFMLTYGDGLSDVDINKLIEFHKHHGGIATLTAVRQVQMKGVIDIGGDNAVKKFREKSHKDDFFINAGFMVLEPEIFDYITDDQCVFEQYTIPRLVEQKQLMSYMHEGFWHCVDSLRDKKELELLISNNKLPWMK